MFYDVVEISPAFVVVEFSGCFGADTPDLVELADDFEARIRFEVGDCLEFAIAGMVFMKEMGNLLVAAGQGKNFSGALDGIGVCSKRRNAAAVSSNADFIQHQFTSSLDLFQLADERLIGGYQWRSSLTGVDFFLSNPIRHPRESAAGCLIVLRGCLMQKASWSCHVLTIFLAGSLSRRGKALAYKVIARGVFDAIPLYVSLDWWFRVCIRTLNDTTKHSFLGASTHVACKGFHPIDFHGGWAIARRLFGGYQPSSVYRIGLQRKYLPCTERVREPIKFEYPDHVGK